MLRNIKIATGTLPVAILYVCALVAYFRPSFVLTAAVTSVTSVPW